tara:strand:- start:86 stop:607 length:522 start_codon:yes stop_codon:yes gene_type:complete
MKLKNIFLAAVTALATALPVQARVEPETHTLLNMLDDDGVVILVNSTMCKRKPIHGAYVTYGDGSRSMVLCPGDEWDPIDHSTVRHEMAHALQHCVNEKRGTPRDTPIIQDIDQLAQLVNTHVPEDQVIFIKSSYPRDKWLVEFEANYVERVLTSTQLMELWNELSCSEVFDV